MPVNKGKIKLWAVAFWLFIWEASSLIIGQEIILVSPVKVIIRLFELMAEWDFYLSAFNSILKITEGFILGTAFGILSASLSYRFKRIEELLSPVLLAIKAVPVASFIILALIMFSSKNLAILISFLMVLPIIYSNILGGLRNADKDMLEMAKVFKIPLLKKIRYIYIPEVFPYFKTACAAGIGMSFKSGIAAEVIGIPTGSIGEKLYSAKVYFDTPDLFAWTLAIVILSLVFEKLFGLLLRKAEKWTVKMK